MYKNKSGRFVYIWGKDQQRAININNNNKWILGLLSGRMNEASSHGLFFWEQTVGLR
jgi:hypothetical protein